jgi:hypothetical protein
MAMTMLTPHDAPSGEGLELPPPAAGANRWRRAVVRGVRQNLLPWLVVKAVLTLLVFEGQVSVGTAFVLDTALSALVIGYGWWLGRR